MFTFAIDKERLLKHFRKDPTLFAYHIGDLDDRTFPHCQFAAVYDETAKIDDCILIYNGLSVPAVLVFGLTGRLEELLDEVMPILPLRFYGHFMSRSHAQLRRNYAETPVGTIARMGLGTFRPTDAADTNVIRLDRSHDELLRRFYRVAHPDNHYETLLLDTGKYMGVISSGDVLAVAGVHVYSPQFGVAVLGNIATHPEHRGKGLASAVTSALCAELAAEKLSISLNVFANNAPAIRCYTKLGFKISHKFEVSLFEAK